MITKERLAELEADPRSASIFKAEMQELAAAYRARVPGLTVTHEEDGVWLHIESSIGKTGSFNMEAFGIQRKGVAGQAVLEWVDSFSAVKEPT